MKTKLGENMRRPSAAQPNTPRAQIQETNTFTSSELFPVITCDNTVTLAEQHAKLQKKLADMKTWQCEQLLVRIQVLLPGLTVCSAAL